LPIRGAIPIILGRERRHDRHDHPGRAHVHRQPRRIPQGAGRLNNSRLLQLARAADLFPHRADLAPSGTNQRGPDQRAVRHGMAARPGPLQLHPGGHQTGRGRGDHGDLAPQRHPGPAVHHSDRRGADSG
jgi:hypothetical protein